jgi:hypothetical protein
MKSYNIYKIHILILYSRWREIEKTKIYHIFLIFMPRKIKASKSFRKVFLLKNLFRASNYISSLEESFIQLIMNIIFDFFVFFVHIKNIRIINRQD